MTEARAQSPSGCSGAEEWRDSAKTERSTSRLRCHSDEAYSSMPVCVYAAEASQPAATSQALKLPKPYTYSKLSLPLPVHKFAEVNN